jgi:LacI family transcriptional regulator
MQALGRFDAVTGIFAVNDVIAMAAIQQAMELGLNVPADLSVVGFNDVELASYFRPGITTIRMPGFAMGEAATEIVARAIRGERRVRSVSLPVELVVRDSTAPAPES